MKKTTNRIIKAFLLLSIFAALFAGISATTLAAGKTISKAKAKQIALKEAGIKSTAVTKWSKARLDKSDNEWDVEFQTKTRKYEVEINARTGKVKSFESKKIKKATITKTEAKKAALKRAKLDSSDVKKWTKILLDDNEWDLKFQTATHKYEVEINARNGKIKDFEKKKLPSASGTDISLEDAKSIALAHAKKQITITGDVRYKKAKLDRDDGKDVYDIEIRYNGWEFEYEINARTGKIIEWDMDFDD